MDKSVKPGTDFFRYVNGAWADRTTIPPDRTTFGSSAVLRDIAEGQVRTLLDEWAASTSLPAGADEAKLARLYRSFLNETAAETRDAAPLAPRLAAIRAATTREAMATLMGEASRGAGAAVFAAGVSDDVRNPEQYTLYLSQSGLGLQDREFYLRDNFAPQKKAYRDYVARMLGLAGWTMPERGGRRRGRLRDPHRRGALDEGRKPQSRQDLQPDDLVGARRQRTGLLVAGLRQGGRHRQAQPRSSSARTRPFRRSPQSSAKRRWRRCRPGRRSASSTRRRRYLSSRFVDRALGVPLEVPAGRTGTSAPAGSAPSRSPRVAWARRSAARTWRGTSRPTRRRRWRQLVADLRAAMRLRIEALPWMEPATKTAALEKLAKFGVKIGYPSKWRDYSALEVTDDLFGNGERVAAFEWARDVARIGGPVDDDEWGMTPQTVNAYYSSAKNEIVFPAAILQPPFFDPQADPAVNYGAIGGVIGHEITHGFDDQGRKSDGEGVLRDWWTPEDAKRFEAQADRLGAQYEAYVFPTLPGMKLTARIVMGENIGDLGGVLLGLDAYRLSLKGAPAPVLDGFTGTQRVFLGWAQVWRIKSRDDALRQQIVNDSHSPGFIRAFAPLRNVDAWYEAFDVKPGDALYIAPEQRVRIW